LLRPGFELFIAWRHLRDPERRSHRTLWFGLALLLLGGLALAVAAFAPRFLHLPVVRGPGEFLRADPLIWLENVKIGGFVAVVIGLLVTLLGVLFALFTVFTAVSIFGVFLGTAAPIIVLSVMSGFENDLKTKIRATKADVVIDIPDDRPFADAPAVLKKIAGIPGIVGAMPYLETEVIIKHATNPAGMGIILRGIDPTLAPRVLGIERTMQEGKLSWLSHPDQIPADPDRPQFPGILLGEELYQRILRVFVGSDVDIVCPICGVGPAGPMPKLKPFRVAGHFYSGMYEFDSKLAYADLPDVQKFVGAPGEVTGIEVRTTNPEVAGTVAEAISQRLGPGYEVRSWEELNRSLFGALKLEKMAMFIALTFIDLVASFSVISTLLMLATEKGREIAILKSMGARSGAIVRIFVAEGLYIGVLGLVLGLVLGIGGSLFLARYGLPLDPDVYYIQKLPVVMRGTEIAALGLAALALSCLATVYPALLASRMRPVDGLRYE
jgi:lipoprotein-releasing system permease protein